MERIRKPFQGVTNIVRFNWHFYLLSGCFILLVLIFAHFLPAQLRLCSRLFCLLAIVLILISLLVSFYIYDLSGLYDLDWLNEMNIRPDGNIININAGFDEMSVLLRSKYREAQLQVFDFYDPEKHTEVSIERARKAYPPYHGTTRINTDALPLQNDLADAMFLILAAHEIRSDEERVNFFKEMRRVIKSSGKIIVTEHLRDVPNLLAYNIGAFHFLSKATWLKTFRGAGLGVLKEMKINPFITTFILQKNGTAS